MINTSNFQKYYTLSLVVKITKIRCVVAILITWSMIIKIAIIQHFQTIKKETNVEILYLCWA